jgi:hypothetical protein
MRGENKAGLPDIKVVGLFIFETNLLTLVTMRKR